MHYFKNMIMLSVNGLMIVSYGFFMDFLIKIFDVTTTTAETIILTGSVLAFLPLIFKLDIFEKTSSWESVLLIFWKRTHHTSETVKQISFLGIFPIHESVVHSTHRINQPTARQIADEAVDLALAFVPLLNGYMSTGRHLMKLMR